MQYPINRNILIISAAALVMLGGCTLEEAKDSATPAPTLAETKSAVAASQPAGPAPSDHPDHPGHEDHAKPESAAPAAPPMTGAPMAGAPMTGAPMAGAPMMADPTAPLTSTPELDAAIKDAEKAGDKTRIGAAYTKRGVFRMNDAKAGARVKYRAALSDLRKALAAVPEQKEAKQAKEQIEGIYASMGRPVPTDDVP